MSIPFRPRRGRLVDQLGALRGQPLELGRDVVDLEGDVVHPRAAPLEEPADRRVGIERGEQLDPVVADAQQRRLDALARPASRAARPRLRTGAGRSRRPRRDRRRRRRDDGSRSRSRAPMLPMGLVNRARTCHSPRRCGSRWLARSRRSPCSSWAAAAARARPRRRLATTTTSARQRRLLEVGGRDRRRDADGGLHRDERAHRRRRNERRLLDLAQPEARQGQGRRRPHRPRRARLRHHPDRPEGLHQRVEELPPPLRRIERRKPLGQVVLRLRERQGARKPRVADRHRRADQPDPRVARNAREGRRPRRSTGSLRSRSTTRRTAASSTSPRPGPPTRSS